MAELIVTDAERAAASYLDWDDASLGRFCKYCALTFDKLSDDDEGLRKITALSCAMLLAGTAYETNAEIELNLSGLVHGGSPAGDWIVTVKRRKPA